MGDTRLGDSLFKRDNKCFFSRSKRSLEDNLKSISVFVRFF